MSKYDKGLLILAAAVVAWTVCLFMVAGGIFK